MCARLACSGMALADLPAVESVPARAGLPADSRRRGQQVLRVSLIRSGLIACGVVALAGLGGCKQEVQFTRIPVLGVIDPDLKPNETSIHLSVPVDLQPLLAAAEQAVGEQIKARDLVEDIACDRRKGPAIECNDAIVVTELTRAGPMSLSAEGHALQVRIPFRYTVSAKGQGWAAYLGDGKTGTVSAVVPFELALGTGYRLEARLGNEIGWSEKSVQVLRGKIAFARFADAKLKAQLKGAAEALRKAVAEQPIREATESAWRALHEPIEVGRAPDLWLRTLPERLTGGGFAVEDGGLVYRVRVDARVALHRGAKPSALFQKAVPDPQKQVSRSAAATQEAAHGRTVLRLPVEFGMSSLLDTVRASFPPADVIETRADAKSAVVKVKPSKVDLLPARDKLALSLQLELVEPKRLFGMIGKAYLVGKPSFDAASGILEVKDITFPPPLSREAAAATGLRIGEEPFAGRFALAARLDIGAAVRDLLPRINERIDQPLGSDMTLRGRFDDIAVTSVEPIEGALRANVALTGDLALRYASKRAGKVEPASGPSATPLVP